MVSLDAQKISQQYLHRILLGSIAPRPIALASTIDQDGNPNLSPFSFFNAFGVNPGTLIFSPSRRGRDNTTKHTFENLLEVPEVVINTVNFEMVQQMSLSSCEYPKGTNEFIKAGFHMLASDKIRPFRVAESPVQYECKVREIIQTGEGPGAGNLVICDILKVHIKESVLDENQEIDQHMIDLVGRMGGNYYVRTHEAARFIVPKPSTKNGIGIDALPEAIKRSEFLTGNDLGQLGNLSEWPSVDEIVRFKNETKLQKLFLGEKEHFYRLIRETIHQGMPQEALAMLLAFLAE